MNKARILFELTIIREQLKALNAKLEEMMKNEKIYGSYF